MPGVDIDRFFHGAAPELVDPQRFRLTDTGATTASDVYAFGVLAWEVSRGRVVFSVYILRQDGVRFLPDALRSRTRARLRECIRC